MTDTQFDSKRRLCPDGSCVGVIGADGRCRECGRNASGKPDIALVDNPPEDAEEDVDNVQAAASAPTETGAGGFDPNRKLCDDGSCVGIIGADGRCNVCGRTSG